MSKIKQNVKTNNRNIKIKLVSDYPSFDILINGERYETYPQDNKNIFDEYSSDRSNRTNRKVQDTNTLQRAIRDRMYKTSQGF